MNFDIALTGFAALYIFMLAAFAGWVIIGRVPAILHTPLMSGSNFVHGIVVVGGLFTLLNARDLLEQSIGFFAVLLGPSAQDAPPRPNSRGQITPRQEGLRT
jgi:NAD(P) transhydrogenase subunit alpha